jgi:hypothetical protein
MASSEADEETEDTGALAAVGCLRAISTILESISSLPHLYIQIEPTLLPILRKMLTSDGQGIVLYCIVLYCIVLSDHNCRDIYTCSYYTGFSSERAFSLAVKVPW